MRREVANMGRWNPERSCVPWNMLQEPPRALPLQAGAHPAGVGTERAICCPKVEPLCRRSLSQPTETLPTAMAVLGKQPHEGHFSTHSLPSLPPRLSRVNAARHKAQPCTPHKPDLPQLLRTAAPLCHGLAGSCCIRHTAPCPTAPHTSSTSGQPAAPHLVWH